MNSNEQAAVTIDFEKPLDGDSLSDIQELATLISSNVGLDVRGERDGAPGKAKPVLTSTLAVIGAVTGVAGLVLQAIGIWKSNKRKYSITITENGNSYTVDHLSQAEYLDLVKRLNKLPPSQPVVVDVSKHGVEA